MSIENIEDHTTAELHGLLLANYAQLEIWISIRMKETTDAMKRTANKVIVETRQNIKQIEEEIDKRED